MKRGGGQEKCNQYSSRYTLNAFHKMINIHTRGMKGNSIGDDIGGEMQRRPKGSQRVRAHPFAYNVYNIRRAC